MLSDQPLPPLPMLADYAPKGRDRRDHGNVPSETLDEAESKVALMFDGLGRSNVIDLMEALRKSLKGGGRRTALLRTSSSSKKTGKRAHTRTRRRKAA